MLVIESSDSDCFDAKTYMKRNKMSLKWSVCVGITHPGWVWECSGLTITPVSWWHHSITIWRVSISQTIQQPRQQASSSPPPRSSILLLSLHNSSPIGDINVHWYTPCRKCPHINGQWTFKHGLTNWNCDTCPQRSSLTTGSFKDLNLRV